jgi:hypothetical protein
MKWSAEQEDLSLLPYMTATEKEALRRAGVSTIQALAALKDFAAGSKADLAPAPGREAQVGQIAATWPVGPRLDELVHRARSFRRSVRKDGTQALSYIPGKGNSSLPVATWAELQGQQRVRRERRADYGPEEVRAAGERAGQAVRRKQADLLCDIVGNPFRPVALAPAWLTPVAEMDAATAPHALRPQFGWRRP